MNRIKTVTAAIIATLVLTPTLTACNLTSKDTCEAMAFVAPPKPPAPKAPKVQQPKPKAPVVKEPKRDGNGGVIVDTRPNTTRYVDYDDCDDDDD